MDQATTRKADSVLLVAVAREWATTSGNTYHTMRVVFPDSHNIVLGKQYGHGHALFMDRAKCAFIDHLWKSIDPASMTVGDMAAFRDHVEDLLSRVVVLVDHVRVSSRKQLHTEGEWL